MIIKKKDYYHRLEKSFGQYYDMASYYSSEKNCQYLRHFTLHIIQASPQAQVPIYRDEVD